MDIRWIANTDPPSPATRFAPADLQALREREDGFLWVDIPRCDRETAVVLENELGLHPRAIQDCRDGVTAPKHHFYQDHVFVALHTLRRSPSGALEPVQFNQFVGRTFLVTVHGPVRQDVTYRLGVPETSDIASRIDSGRLRPSSPSDLGATIVAGQVQALDELVVEIASKVLAFERKTASDALDDLDPLLDELFRLRLGLGVIRTTAFNCRQVYQRVHDRLALVAADVSPAAAELRDGYDRVVTVCEAQKELLQDVLDFYQTRLTNDLNTTLKRFTAMGSILVICTLISSIYGMNFVHMPELSWRLGYPLALASMGVVSGALALFFRRRHWL